MSVFVTDASVAAKWILPAGQEPYQNEAVHLLRQFTEGKIEIVVPHFFWIEVTNILWKAARAGRCTRANAEAALDALRKYELPTVADLPLLNSALEKALDYGRTVYDSVYIALAVELKAQFITADEKLVNAVASAFPVRWLGAI